MIQQIETITLRAYQVEPVRKAVEYLNADGGVPSLIVLPTAWGKSVLTAFAARSIAQEDKLLVLQPSKELLEQNYRKYMQLCGLMASAGIYSASAGRKQVERITYATIGSIKNLGSKFKAMGFTKMLIDEAHLYPRSEESMLGGFLRDSGITQVLGITATPLKLEQYSEKQGERFDKWSELIMLTNLSPSGSFFKQILHIGQIGEMTKLKYWTPLTYERIPFDPSLLRYNSTGSDFSKDSEEEAYKLNNIRANIYAALNWHTERKHCLVFVPAVEEAQILASEYPSAAFVSGDMGKRERERIIRLFREGEIRVIFNCSVLGTGFDYPEIDMIIFATSTASVARYYQFCGRGVRIHEKKKDCLIVDMGGNVDRFGRVEDITFEHQGRWRMYGSGGILLSGLPVNCLGSVRKEDIQRAYSNYQVWEPRINFGRYKGLTCDQMPHAYKAWLLTNAGRRIDTAMRDALLLSLENHIRDTTQDPPAQMIPDGQYAGYKIENVPRGYLAWYYNSKSWNECNDSLRRGIELQWNGVPKYFKAKLKK